MTKAFNRDQAILKLIAEELDPEFMALIPGLTEFLCADQMRDVPPAVRTAEALYRLLYYDMNKTINDIYTNVPPQVGRGDYSGISLASYFQYYTTAFPLFYALKDGSGVVVFKNIPISGPSPSHLDKFKETVKKELEDKVRSRRWEGAAGIKTVKKREVVTWAKFIRMLGGYKTCSDHLIRDGGQRMSDIAKPMELVIGKTKADYDLAYNGKITSCMDHSREHQAIWASVFQDDDWPTDMYSFIPECSIAIFKKGSTVVGRSILLGNNAIRLFPCETQFLKLAGKLLRNAGYNPDGYRFECRSEFKVPGKIIKAQMDRDPTTAAYYCPYPYFDNNATSMLAKFDEETKEFSIKCIPPFSSTTAESRIVTAHPGWAVVPSNSAKGYFTNHDLKRLVCHVCGNVFTTKLTSPPPHNTAGWRACSKICVERAGCCIAINVDAVSVVCDQANAVKDAIDNYWYTNEYVAERNGHRMWEKNSLLAPEDEEFTRLGATTTVNGISYGMLDGDLGRLETLADRRDAGINRDGRFVYTIAINYAKNINLKTVKSFEYLEVAPIEFDATILDKELTTGFFPSDPQQEELPKPKKRELSKNDILKTHIEWTAGRDAYRCYVPEGVVTVPLNIVQAVKANIPRLTDRETIMYAMVEAEFEEAMVHWENECDLLARKRLGAYVGPEVVKNEELIIKMGPFPEPIVYSGGPAMTSPTGRSWTAPPMYYTTNTTVGEE